MTGMMVQSLFIMIALGSGLMAGVFFTFSSFVMQALARLPAAHGIAAMQAINVTVINPLFMLGFMGTAVLCGILVIGIRTGLLVSNSWAIVGCLFYLLGTFLITIACNVPRNEQLAKIDADAIDGVSVWEVYVKEWTAWNHVRTACAFAAAGVMTIALMR
jgi:uncharacterized membrane protein